MTDHDDDRDARKTDPVSHAPPDAPDITSGSRIPVAARVPQIRPDPNSFSEQAMQAILDGMAELKLARAAFDADALLCRQTEVFASIVTDRYEMIRGPLVEIHSKLTELVTRVDKHDARLVRLESSEERLEKLELELVTMRAQMERLEQLRPHLERLEKMLALLKKEGTDVTAEATAAPGQPPEHPSDP